MVSMLAYCLLLQIEVHLWCGHTQEIKFEEELPPIRKAQMGVIMQVALIS